MHEDGKRKEAERGGGGAQCGQERMALQLMIYIANAINSHGKSDMEFAVT